MPETVEFYRLNRKFVDSGEASPSSENLIYHAVALGHHIGVLDCFQKVLVMPEKSFSRLTAGFPRSEGRRKLEGLLKWKEIEITSDQAGPLLREVEQAVPTLPPEDKKAAQEFCDLLRLMEKEPTIYLVVRLQ